MALPDIWRGRRGALWDIGRDPFREISRLQREIDRMFQNFLTPVSEEVLPVTMQGFTPSCDIEERDNAYILSFDLPGVKQEDIHISVQDNQLIVSGERKQEHEEKAKGRQYSERFYGTYSRSFTLPRGVKGEDVEADYRDGVLRVAVPKGEAAERSHEIKLGTKKHGLLDQVISGQGEAKKEEKVASEKKKPAEKPAEKPSEKPGEKVA